MFPNLEISQKATYLERCLFSLPVLGGGGGKSGNSKEESAKNKYGKSGNLLIGQIVNR